MSEPTIKLVAFCGSLRKGSFNRLALQAFIERLPQGTSVETIEIGDWPLYNADVQAQGFPNPVQTAQQKMLAAELRQEAARLAHGNALRKRGATYTSQFGSQIINLLKRK